MVPATFHLELNMTQVNDIKHYKPVFDFTLLVTLFFVLEKQKNLNPLEKSTREVLNVFYSQNYIRNFGKKTAERLFLCAGKLGGNF